MTLDISKCWTEHDLCFLDVETTGLSVTGGDAIVDIAVVRFRRGRVVAKWSSFIDPQRDIPQEATAIHQITREMTKGAPTMAEAAADILRVAEGCVPAAYNAAFDRGFLHASIRGSDSAMFDPDFAAWVDPLVVIRKIDRFAKGKGRHKLDVTCKRWGVEMDGQSHRALTDATAAGMLLYRLLSVGHVKPCALGKYLEHQERESAAQDESFRAYQARLAKQEQSA